LIMALSDITNVDGAKRTAKKRLSDGSMKSYTYNVYRKQLELQFDSESEKLQFSNQLEGAK
jgi:hypothetical protein